MTPSTDSVILNPDYAVILMNYIHTFRPRDLFYLLPRQLDAGQLFREMSKTGMLLRRDKTELNIDSIAARLKEFSGFSTEVGDGVNDFKPSQGACARDAAVELCWFAQTKLSQEELANNTRLFELITYIVSHPTIFNCGKDDAALENEPGLLMYHTLQWYLSNVQVTRKQTKSLKSWYEKCGAPELEEGPQERVEKEVNPDYAQPLLNYSHTRILRYLFYLLPRHLDTAQLFRDMSNVGLVLPGNQTENNLDAITARLKNDNDEDYDSVNDYPPSQLAQARDAVVELCWFAQTRFLPHDLNNNTQLFELVTYIVSHPAIFNCGSAGVPLENGAGRLIHHALHWYLSVSPDNKSRTEVLNSWYEKCTAPACKDDSEDVYLNSTESVRTISEFSDQNQEEQDGFNPDYAQPVSKFSLSGRPKHLFSHLPRHLNPAQLFREMSKLGLVLPHAEAEPNLDGIAERVKDVRVFRGKNYDGVNDYPPSQRPRARDAVVELCWYAQTKYSPEELANNTHLFELISYIVSHPAIFNCGNAGAITMENIPGLLLHHVLQWYLLIVPVSKKQTKTLMTLYEKCSAHEFDDDPEAGYSSSGGSVSDPSDDDSEDDD